MIKKFIDLKDYFSLAIKLILILSIANAIYLQLWHIMSANIFLLLLMFTPQIIKKSYNVKIPKEFEFLLLLFVLTTFFVGRLNWAIAPILFGIAAGFIGFFISLILYSNNQIKKNAFLIVFFSFNLAVAFGAILEFIKYYLKLLIGQPLTTGTYSFSMQTMTYVILGAIISSIIGYLYIKEHKSMRLIGEAVMRFKKTNPEVFLQRDSSKEILELIKKGENDKTEFKSTLRVNLHTGEQDKKIEQTILKTITAFLNSQGGCLLIGVSNKGEILGIEKDQFENSDKFNLHLTNLIKQKIGKKCFPFVRYDLLLIEEKQIMKIDCFPSDQPIFLQTPEGEEFYVRMGPSTNQLIGSELLSYVEKRFKKEK